MTENFKGYNGKARFHLPGAFDRWKIYDILISFMEDNKTMFYENIEIGSIYGSPDSIWNGGRSATEKISKENLIKDKNFYSQKKIPIRFTFTNPLITKKEYLYDTYSNMILGIFDNGLNEILCNTELLENYIRNKYGNSYKYISSTTKGLNDINSPELIEEFKKDYKYIVLDYNYNNDFSIISELSNNNVDISKIELLCNPVCNPKCPIRKNHYEYIGETQLFGSGSDPCNTSSCRCQIYTLFDVIKSPLFISKDNINKYIDLGINNFKIEGRTAHIFDIIEILSYYLVKSEHELEFRERMNICLQNN